VNAKKLICGIAGLVGILLLLFACKVYLHNREVEQEKAAEAARVAAREAAEDAIRNAGRTELRASALAWADWLASWPRAAIEAVELDQHRADLDMLIQTDQKYLTVPQLQTVQTLIEANGRLRTLLAADTTEPLDEMDRRITQARQNCRDAVQAFLDTFP
jgi:citrate lyase beta subunit